MRFPVRFSLNKFCKLRKRRRRAAKAENNGGDPYPAAAVKAVLQVIGTEKEDKRRRYKRKTKLRKV